VAVRGYAGDVSVAPGNAIDLHLAGADPSARLDVFRMGLRDAHHVVTVRNVPVSHQPTASADPQTGRIEDQWPISYWLQVPTTWRSGVYLVKLTGTSGGQSYVIFVVRNPRPMPFTVVLPVMTYEAYNQEGGADLYGWDGGPHARAYEVSFDRPFTQEFGAGLFFWLDFPLIVWLEDHGYDPAYVTDLDIARNPQLVEGVDTLVFSGHSEYWTGGMRDIVEAQAQRGTNLAFFGANQAFWQVRLAPNHLGTVSRTMVCYKDASLDPVTAVSPGGATTRFQDPPVNLAPSRFMGVEYAGIVNGIQPMVLGPDITTFAPGSGLYPGESLDGLIVGEIDQVTQPFTGRLLAATPVAIGAEPSPVTATAAAALWVNQWGGRVFDAGTFGFAWGLDPRYAAGLPGFPADAFSQLTALILAWAGAQPDPLAVSQLGAANVYEAVAGNFASPAGAIGYAELLGQKGLTGFVVEEETSGKYQFQVERSFVSKAAAAAEVAKLHAAHDRGWVETDTGSSR
jgi:hypothetical protein